MGGVALGLAWRGSVVECAPYSMALWGRGSNAIRARGGTGAVEVASRIARGARREQGYRGEPRETMPEEPGQWETGQGFPVSPEARGPGGHSLHYPQEGVQEAIQEASIRGLLG